MYENQNMGTDTDRSELSSSIAVVLGSAVTMYFKTHGHHWNVKGRDFAEFHAFFQEIYEDIYESIDPTAELMLKMGHDAPYRLQDFMDLNQTQDMDVTDDPFSMLADLYSANDVLIAVIGQALDLAANYNEQGVINFLADRDDMHKKWRWQIGAYLTPTDSGMPGKSEAAELLDAGDTPVVEQLMDDADGCPLCGASGCVCPGCDGGTCLCDSGCVCTQCLSAEEYGQYSSQDLYFSFQEQRVEALQAAGVIVAEEQDLAAALLEIADKYGKFNEDETGIWAGYTPAAENEYKEIGVKCINCVLYDGPGVCKIIAPTIEDDGKCRFAVIPDGVVNVDGEDNGDGEVIVAAGEADACPVATQDIQVNLKNRQNAIDNVGYGPLNPNEPNEEFWQEKADNWKTTPEEAKTSVCGNCVFFVRTPKMLDCIAQGLEQGDSSQVDADAAIDQADLGYCQALDFKCAATRTCNSWAVGGPITAASSKPAPKKDRIHGSDKNKPGSAAGSKKIVFSARTEKTLSGKVQDHNKDAKPGRKATLPMLKAVYRRGSGAFSSSHRPGMTRDGWAMARVNAFLKLLKSGSPANPNYKQDNDLLPKAHPKSSRAEASLMQHELLSIALKTADEYGSPEHAIHAMAEYSSLGYEAIPALRGAWLRGVRDGDIPFERAYTLATKLYESKDADLLPKKRKG
jgi:starvation-inducible DNA-binding protein